MWPAPTRRDYRTHDRRCIDDDLVEPDLARRQALDRPDPRQRVHKRRRRLHRRSRDRHESVRSGMTQRSYTVGSGDPPIVQAREAGTERHARRGEDALRSDDCISATRSLPDTSRSTPATRRRSHHAWRRRSAVGRTQSMALDRLARATAATRPRRIARHDRRVASGVHPKQSGSAQPAGPSPSCPQSHASTDAPAVPALS